MAKRKGKRLSNPPNDKATRAIEGQLAAVSDKLGQQLGKQSRRFDKESGRVLRSIGNLAEQQADFSRRLIAQSKGERASYGTAGGAVDSRIASAKAGARYAGAAATAQKKTSKAVVGAGRGAIGETFRTGAKMSKNAMSLLNVLAAQAESQFQHEIFMAQLGFDQSVALQKLQNDLQKDYTAWTYEQGYAETPDEARREEWKYRRKELMLSQRFAQKDQDKAAFANWDAYNTQITNAIVDTQATIGNDASWQAVLSAAETESMGALGPNGQRAGGSGVPVRDIIVNKLSPTTEELPSTVDPGVIRNVIGDMVDNRIAGVETGPGPASGPGYAPNWKTVQSYIQSADTDGSLTAYMARKGRVLEQAHKDFRMIAGVAASTDAAVNELKTKEGGIGTAVGTIGAAAAVTGAAVLARKGRQGTKVAQMVAEGLQDQFTGVSADSLVGHASRSKAATITRRALAQGGSTSMFSDIIPGLDPKQLTSGMKALPAGAKALPAGLPAAGPGGVTEIEVIENAYLRKAISEGEYAALLKQATPGAAVRVGTKIWQLFKGLGGEAFSIGGTGLSLLQRFNPELYNELMGIGMSREEAERYIGTSLDTPEETRIFKELGGA